MAKIISCEKFFTKHFNNSEFEELILEMKQQNSFDANLILRIMSYTAKTMGYELEDTETWNAEKNFKYCLMHL